jgi:hypothetical protein
MPKGPRLDSSNNSNAKPAISVSGGSGGNIPQSEGGNVHPATDVNYAIVAHMIKQSEEKQEAKLNSIENSINTKLSGMATKWTIWGAVGSSVVAIIGIGLAILSLVGDRFDGGISFGRSVGDDILKNRIAIEDSQKNDKALNEKLDKILDKISSSPTTK